MWETWSLREKALALVLLLLLLVALSIISWQYKQISLLKEDLFIMERLNQERAEELAASAADHSQAHALEAVTPSPYVVDVKGAVQRPGVYQLPHDGRVIDAIEIAGGLLETASTRFLNLATPLQDGMAVYIPFQGEEGEVMNQGNPLIVQPAGADSLININTANKEELMGLPGIGEGKALAIIQYREEQGRFQNVDDLLQVSGIGAKTLERFRNLITVE